MWPTGLGRDYQKCRCAEQAQQHKSLVVNRCQEVPSGNEHFRRRSFRHEDILAKDKGILGFKERIHKTTGIYLDIRRKEKK